MNYFYLFKVPRFIFASIIIIIIIIIIIMIIIIIIMMLKLQSIKKYISFFFLFCFNDKKYEKKYNTDYKIFLF